MSATDQQLPLAQMTSYELRDYKQDLQTALGMAVLPPVYLSREELQGRLDDVRAEEDERERIRRARP